MQGVETLLPPGSITLEPVVKLRKRLRPQAVNAPLSLPLHLDEPRLSQDTQMARDAGPRDRQRLRELTDPRRSIPQHLEDRAPTLIRQRVQHLIHAD